ncbi:hypothetical protein AMTRI_Chr06g193670 [Amborella trichopoda]
MFSCFPQAFLNMVFRRFLFELVLGDAMLSNRFKEAVEKHGNDYYAVLLVRRRFYKNVGRG